MESQMNPIKTFLLAVVLTLAAMVLVQGLVMSLIWSVEKVITWWDYHHPVEEEVTLPMHQQLGFSTNAAYEKHLRSIPDDNDEEELVQVLLNLNVEEAEAPSDIPTYEECEELIRQVVTKDHGKEDVSHVNQDEDDIPKRVEPLYETPIEEHPRSSSAPEYPSSNNDDDRSSCETYSYCGDSCDGD